MYDSQIAKLREMISAIAVEQKNLKKMIDSNQSSLDEINYVLDRAKVGSDADFTIFSPRNIENILADELQDKKEESDILVKTIEFDQNKYDELENQKKFYMNLVDILCSISEKDNSYQSKIDDAHKEKREFINEIRSLLSDLLSCFDDDPDFVRSELLSFLSNLDRLY